MKIDTHTVEGVTIVEITGDLDTVSSRAAQTQILPMVKPRGKLILDFTQVTYMSSAGLRVLLSLYRHSANQDGELVLVGLTAEIRDTMEVTGFLDFFTACPSMQEAMQHLGLEQASSPDAAGSDARKLR